LNSIVIRVRKRLAIFRTEIIFSALQTKDQLKLPIKVCSLKHLASLRSFRQSIICVEMQGKILFVILYM